MRWYSNQIIKEMENIILNSNVYEGIKSLNNKNIEELVRDKAIILLLKISHKNATHEYLAFQFCY